MSRAGRNIPGGNAVFKNSDHKTPEGSADLRTAAAAAIDAPFGDSYTDIVRGAFDDPGETADQYDFSSGAAQHDEATLDTGGELHVKLTSFDGEEAITAVRWGDGDADYQGRVFRHTYKEACTYRVTGVALAKNVQRFTIVVHVAMAATVRPAWTSRSPPVPRTSTARRRSSRVLRWPSCR